MTKKLLQFILIFGLLLVGCASGMPVATPTPSGPQALTVMTHDSFSASEEVVAAFETENNAKVQFLKAGDAGTALNKAILSRGNPLADVFYGVDNTFLSRALDEGVFEAYDSPLLSSIPQEFKLDPQNGALPVDYGDVCPNYDKAYFADKDFQPPENLEDLAKPEYKSLFVAQNPATSSPGLAFLLGTIGHFGEGGYLDYWKSLVANDLLVVNDWEAAYYTEFSAHDGTRPIVVSYASSPPAEVIFAETSLDEPLTAVITGEGSCFRQIEFVGILKGTPHRDLAEKWVDFMLDQGFQSDMPLQMFVFPVNPYAPLPPEFTKFTTLPTSTSQVNPQEIAARRDQWIKDWTEAVLR